MGESVHRDQEAVEEFRGRSRNRLPETRSSRISTPLRTLPRPTREGSLSPFRTLPRVTRDRSPLQPRSRRYDEPEGS